MSQTRPSKQRFVGMTILEIILILPLVGILTLVAMTMIVNYNKSYKYSQLQAQASYQISNYLERMGRVIRSTNDIEAATTNSLTIYAFFSPRNEAPDKVRYFLDSESLKVGVIQATGTPPNYTYDPNAETVSTLLSNVKNGASGIFSYYDENGNQLSGAYSLGSIKEIGVALSLNPDTNFLPKDVSGQTKINLRNKKTNL